jgi:hypothetical protein
MIDELENERVFSLSTISPLLPEGMRHVEYLASRVASAPDVPNNAIAWLVPGYNAVCFKADVETHEKLLKDLRAATPPGKPVVYYVRTLERREVP